MKEITFTVTIDEANIIFKGLGRMPFQEVYQLIGKLNEQANRQLQGTGTAVPSINTAANGNNDN